MISLHEALTAPSGAVCFLAALRGLWLLPDWLAKWQSLIAHRRGVPRREQTHPRRRTRRAGRG